MCLNVLILFYPPPPPSPCTWSSVIWWTLSKSNLEAITKSIFINLHFMVNGCPLQVRMHRFTDPPEVHSRWLFSAKQCTNFQNIELFLKDSINFSSPISIVFQLCWTCHGLTWIFSHQAQRISEKEDLSYLPSFAPRGTVMSMMN